MHNYFPPKYAFISLRAEVFGSCQLQEHLHAPISEPFWGLMYNQSTSLISVFIFLTLLNRLHHIYFSDIKEEKVLVETL